MGMVSTSLPIFSTFGVLIAQNCTSFFLKKFLAAVCCLDLKRRETDFSLKKPVYREGIYGCLSPHFIWEIIGFDPSPHVQEPTKQLILRWENLRLDRDMETGLWVFQRGHKPTMMWLQPTRMIINNGNICQNVWYWNCDFDLNGKN